MLYAHNSTQTKPVLQLFIWYHDNATLSLFTFTFTRTGSAHFLGPDTRLINVSVVCEPDWCVLWTRLVCTVNQTGVYSEPDWFVPGGLLFWKYAHTFGSYVNVQSAIFFVLILEWVCTCDVSLCVLSIWIWCVSVMISVRNVISVLCNWFLLLWMDWGVFISVNTEMTMACPIIGDFSLHLWIDTLGTWKSNRYWRMYVWLSIEKTF